MVERMVAYKYEPGRYFPTWPVIVHCDDLDLTSDDDTMYAIWSGDGEIEPLAEDARQSLMAHEAFIPFQAPRKLPAGWRTKHVPVGIINTEGSVDIEVRKT